MIAARCGESWVICIPHLGGVVGAAQQSDLEIVARRYIATAMAVPVERVRVSISHADAHELDLPCP